MIEVKLDEDEIVVALTGNEKMAIDVTSRVLVALNRPALPAQFDRALDGRQRQEMIDFCRGFLDYNGELPEGTDQ